MLFFQYLKKNEEKTKNICEGHTQTWYVLHKNSIRSSQSFNLIIICYNFQDFKIKFLHPPLSRHKKYIHITILTFARPQMIWKSRAGTLYRESMSATLRQGAQLLYHILEIRKYQHSYFISIFKYIISRPPQTSVSAFFPNLPTSYNLVGLFFKVINIHSLHPNTPPSC